MSCYAYQHMAIIDDSDPTAPTDRNRFRQVRTRLKSFKDRVYYHEIWQKDQQNVK